MRKLAVRFSVERERERERERKRRGMEGGSIGRIVRKERA
jgi:hypothetical protein